MKYSNLINLIAILEFITELVFILNTLRSLRRHHSKEVPDDQKRELCHKGIHYKWDSRLVSLGRAAVDLAFILIVVSLEGLGWLDTELRMITTAPIPLGLLYTCVIFFAYDFFTLPVQWIQKFVVDTKYGINPISKSKFVEGKLQLYLMVVVLGSLFYSVFYYLILALGPDFWIWATPFLSMLILSLDVLNTRIIQPALNNPLIHYGELKLAILSYLKEAGFPIDTIMNIETATSKTNSYPGGCEDRNGSISPTLIHQHSTEEQLVTLARQIGHYKKRYGIGIYIFIFGLIGTALFLFSRVVFSPAISISLGAKELAIHLNLFAGFVVLVPIHFVVKLWLKSSCRRNEY